MRHVDGPPMEIMFNIPVRWVTPSAYLIVTLTKVSSTGLGSMSTVAKPTLRSGERENMPLVTCPFSATARSSPLLCD